MNNNERFV
jgi:hypothetical protein